MKNKRLLSRKERAYIIQKITKNRIPLYKEEYGKLTKNQEDRMVLKIIEKIMAPQDIEEQLSKEQHHLKPLRTKPHQTNKLKNPQIL